MKPPANMPSSVEAQIRNDLQRLNTRIYGLEAAEAVRMEGRTPRRRVEFRSQFGEDALIWELCGRRTTGYYIEVGAFDGYNFAVTYALDCMGWDGLLVEAIPERYEQCVARRPNARVVHAALAGPGSTGTTTFHITEDQFGGMLSYSEASSKHAQRNAHLRRRSVTVPLTTMNDLLAEHKGREIDVAVVDVEGAEGPLLRGFDLMRHRPKLLLIEDNDPKQPNPEVTAIMSTAPYTLLTWFAVNRVYVRNDLEGEYRARITQ